MAGIRHRSNGDSRSGTQPIPVPPGSTEIGQYSYRSPCFVPAAVAPQVRREWDKRQARVDRRSSGDRQRSWRSARAWRPLASSWLIARWSWLSSWAPGRSGASATTVCGPRRRIGLRSADEALASLC
jgi:hypothetical protein